LPPAPPAPAIALLFCSFEEVRVMPPAMF